MKPVEAGVQSELDAAIATFRQLLCSGWELIETLALATHRDPSRTLADWSQANWEMVVEAAVSPDGRIFIEPYGEGADCNDIGSRVWMPGVESTHAVAILPRSGNTARDALLSGPVSFPTAGYVFDRFVARDRDWYIERPPFDHVLATIAGQDALFLVGDVRFQLAPVGRGSSNVAP